MEADEKILQKTNRYERLLTSVSANFHNSNRVCEPIKNCPAYFKKVWKITNKNDIYMSPMQTYAYGECQR